MNVAQAGQAATEGPAGQEDRAAGPVHDFSVSMWALGRQAIPMLIEVAVIPAVVFYLILDTVGLTGAMLGALGWFAVALARRAIQERRLSMLLLIAALPMAFRVATSLVTHSALVYFAQPVLATAALGVGFVISALLGRPIIERLATDMCPLPPQLLRLAPVRRLMMGLSVLWGFVFVIEAAGVAVAFFNLPLSTFALAHAGLYWGPTAVAAVASAVWFVRSAGRHGIRVRLAFARPAPAAV